MPTQDSYGSFFIENFKKMPKKIAVGDQIPNVTMHVNQFGTIQKTTTHDLFRAKNAVILTAPSAFSPTCTTLHLPGFVEYAPEFFKIGVDIIACVAPSAPELMTIWARGFDPQKYILMLPDFFNDFSYNAGILTHTEEYGYIPKRTVMYIENLQVKFFIVEPNIVICSATSGKSCLETLSNFLKNYKR